MASTLQGVSLVEQALSSPTQFGFGELLADPSVQALASAPADSSEGRAHALARLFACGTWTEYTASSLAGTLPEAHENKLKLLSFVSLVSGQHELRYADPSTLTALGCTDWREAETILADAIAAGLVSGHIDEPSKTLYIAFVSTSRDLSLVPSASAPDLGTLAKQLEQWVQTIARAKQQIVQQLDAMRTAPQGKLVQQLDHEQVIRSRMPLALWQAANKPNQHRDAGRRAVTRESEAVQLNSYGVRGAGPRGGDGGSASKARPKAKVA